VGRVVVGNDGGIRLPLSHVGLGHAAGVVDPRMRVGLVVCSFVAEPSL
jgi:hypothetical protein